MIQLANLNKRDMSHQFTKLVYKYLDFEHLPAVTINHIAKKYFENSDKVDYMFLEKKVTVNDLYRISEEYGEVWESDETLVEKIQLQ